MMRKFLAVLTALAIIICTCPLSLADGNAGSDIKIYVDSIEVLCEKKPVVENSRTLVPIRAVAEKAGIAVGWDGEKREASLYFDFVTATLTIGSDSMTVYNSLIDEIETVTLDAVPKIIDGSTYITMRAALEAVGAGVVWDGDTRSIYVISPEKMSELRLSGITAEEYTEQNKTGMGGGEEIPPETEPSKDGAESTSEPDIAPPSDSTEKNGDNTSGAVSEPDSDAGNDSGNPGEDSSTGDDSSGKDSESGESGDADNADNADVNEPETNTGEDGNSAENDPAADEAPKEADIDFSGFRRISGNSIKANELHGLYGRIRTDKPLISVRCRVTDSDIDVLHEIDPEKNETSYSIYTYFNKKVKLNSAGVGDHTFEIYAAVRGGKEQLIFSYDYTVTEAPSVTRNPDKDKDDEEIKDALPDRDDNDSEITPLLSYYGFRTMSGNKITEGAPHGLYGTVKSNAPLTRVRCVIAGTDMDYTVKLDAINEITSYGVFTYFDKLIRFSDAGLGKQTFEVYAAAEGTSEQLLFSYEYTVIEKEAAEEDRTERESVDYTSPEFPENVCLPLEGNIRLTSPYGFRAYNKWEFHKGIDIVSESLNILSVADGVVVDCATGRNSGAGNYVAIQHEGGWVSLYYHLKSYSVKVGDKVKMGQVIAIMGNTGGNYGVHLHFMTCDNWYGGIWATQNNHHTAPHEYVPQILTGVKYYTPNYEQVNKDKIILCNFHFPHILQKGTAYSISSMGAFAATENNVESINLVICDKDGKIFIDETETNPKSTTDGYYIYTSISVKLDMKCHFDKLEPGEYILRVYGETENGRSRVLYTKAFEVVEKDDKQETAAAAAQEDAEGAQESTVDTCQSEENAENSDETENGTESSESAADTGASGNSDPEVEL